MVFVMESGDTEPNLILNAFTVPDWAIVLISLLPPAWRLRSFVLRRAKQAVGLCPACRYDCRVTPDRCPECGLHLRHRAQRVPIEK